MFRPQILFAFFAIAAAAQTASRAETTPTPSQIDRRTSTLTIVVSGLHNTKGQVLLYVWNGPDGFPKNGSKRYLFLTLDATKAVNGRVTASVEIAPGTYAVTAVHDENQNGRMDTNFLGIPTEGYGASNNVITHFGPPKFQESSFELDASGHTAAILIRY
jgi:uncharacterized protein (DUF2141 family)